MTITTSPGPIASARMGSSASAVAAQAPRRQAGRASNSDLISGPAQNTRSTRAASTAAARPAWRSADVRAQLEHVGERDDPAARRPACAPRLARAAATETGTGVVALVDQDEAPAGGVDQARSAPRPASGSKSPSAARPTLQIDIQRAHHQQRAEAHRPPVRRRSGGSGTRRAGVVDPRLHRRPARSRGEADQLGVGALGAAEGAHACAPRRRASAFRIVEPAVVGVEDRQRRRARGRRGFRPWRAPRPASPSAKFSTCTASTVVMATACGRTISDSGVISPAWFMPISKIARSRVGRHPRQGQGHADVVVVGLHRPVARPAQIEAGADGLGDAGLADRAGDRSAPRAPGPGARRLAEPAQAFQGVADHDAGAVDRSRRQRPGGPVGQGGRDERRGRRARRPGRRTGRRARRARLSMDTPSATNAGPVSRRRWRRRSRREVHSGARRCRERAISGDRSRGPGRGGSRPRRRTDGSRPPTV